MQFLNHYVCPCGHTWDDTHDCMCNDRCPVCNKEIVPESSDEECPVCNSFTCKGCEIPDDAEIGYYITGSYEERVESGLQAKIDSWMKRNEKGMTD